MHEAICENVYVTKRFAHFVPDASHRPVSWDGLPSLAAATFFTRMWTFLVDRASSTACVFDAVISTA